jgi:hypothetical protein
MRILAYVKNNAYATRQITPEENEIFVIDHKHQNGITRVASNSFGNFRFGSRLGEATFKRVARLILRQVCTNIKIALDYFVYFQPKKVDF